MKFVLKGPFRENTHRLMRQAGYCLQDREELSFTRPPRGYPRFHIYLEEDGEDLILNLHLDQKKPVYKGVTAHSGEYQDKTVEEEAERIKQRLQGKNT